MPTLNNAQIQKLIDSISSNPVDFANIVYNFFLTSGLTTREQQVSALNDVIGHFKNYSVFSRATLLTKTTINVGISPPKYLYEIQTILKNKQDDRSVRSEKILALILQNSSLAIAKKSEELETAEDLEDENKKIEKQHLDLKALDEYIHKNNEKLVVEYRNIVANIHALASLLLSTIKFPLLDSDKQTDNIVLLNQIIKHLESVNEVSDFDYKKPPVDAEYLVSYAKYLVTLEIDIYKEGKIVAQQEKHLRKSFSCTEKMLTALSKFLEILFNIKNTIKKFFSAHKKDTDAEAGKAPNMPDGKSLTLFYDSIDPDLDKDMKTIKSNIEKLRDLPIRPS